MTPDHKGFAAIEKGVALLGALIAVAAPWTASAAQSDALIDQLGQGSSWAAPMISQIVPTSAVSAFVAQAPSPRASSAASFQAGPAPLSFAQAASAEQLSQQLSSGGKPAELAFLGYGLDLGSYRRSGAGSSAIENARGNLWQQDWRGEDNLQFAAQDGAGNRALQRQYGAHNVSILFQRGNANVAEILQLSDQGVATLTQEGSRNSASVIQGTAGSFATIAQSGVANIVAVRQ